MDINVTDAPAEKTMAVDELEYFNFVSDNGLG